MGYSFNMVNPTQRILELEEQIAELKANWPAHSVQPWMLEQIEELEEELEALKDQNHE